MSLSEINSENELEEFIYLISHDLQACARALYEIPQWIREDLVDQGFSIEGTLDRNMVMMETAATRLDQMIRDLLEYSRVGRGDQENPTNLEPAVNEAVNSVILPKGFKICVDLRITQIKMGRADLIRVFTSLLSNAIKHHDRPTGEIRISAWDTKKFVNFTVSDDGPGIENKFHEKVVQPMVMLCSRDKIPGSGLGLSIAKKAANHYGGDLIISEGLHGRGAAIELSILK